MPIRLQVGHSILSYLRFLEPCNLVYHKRFLLFYLITGIGAVVLYSIVNYIEYTQLASTMTEEELKYIKNHGLELMKGGRFWSRESLDITANLFTPMVGASGAIYGLLVGFGVLFPNTEMMMIFLPIPIKAKYFIPIFYFLLLSTSRLSIKKNVAEASDFI